MSDPRAQVVDFVQKSFDADRRRRAEIARLPIEEKLGILVELQRAAAEIAVAAGRPAKPVWPLRVVPKNGNASS